MSILMRSYEFANIKKFLDSPDEELFFRYEGADWDLQ